VAPREREPRSGLESIATGVVEAPDERAKVDWNHGLTLFAIAVMLEKRRPGRRPTALGRGPMILSWFFALRY
jgi:hypothetical protein